MKLLKKEKVKRGPKGPRELPITVFNHTTLLRNGFTEEEIIRLENICNTTKTEEVLRCTNCGLFYPMNEYSPSKIKMNRLVCKKCRNITTKKSYIPADINKYRQQ